MINTMGMKKFIPCVIMVSVALFLLNSRPNSAFPGVQSAALPPGPSFAGSQSCRQCHERFYTLWSSSFHGLAMQPYSSGFAAGTIQPQRTSIKIGDYSYRLDAKREAVIENSSHGEKRYPIEYAMGGKYVYYFLTALDRGRLQTLPIAYDLKKREWFDTALSAVRHFPGQPGITTPNNWKDVPYTFNTACRDCHVSQRLNSFDRSTETFSTTWKEPGINCETCHGPSDEHNSLMRALPKGEKPADYKLVRTKTFTPSQHNDSCNSCHAKAAHLTGGYKAPERFFDHFDLTTLEDNDYYPDGRDLGENYTMTSWKMSPCAQKSQLHCVTCHTSSGRYRFRKPEDANKACLPCHEKKVQNPSQHSHHKVDSIAARCVSCHMPTTEFARMKRSDHSMLPPTPAATIRFKSPNACNGCHSDRDAAWADTVVRSWSSRDYQAPVLKRAGLIEAARKRDWSRLGEILTYITSPARDEIFTTSLVRLLAEADFKDTTATLLKALRDPSPLVRSAAADILAGAPTPEVLQALAESTCDDIRLVRIMAAGSLSGYPQFTAQSPLAARIRKATDEYLAVLASRPISWVAHYNLGNYHLNQGEPEKALNEYETAIKLNNRAAMPRVNAALALVQTGQRAAAEESLRKAVILSPTLATGHYNLGLLAGESGDLPRAEKHLKDAFAADPSMADAAHRLCLILPGERTTEAVEWCRKAVAILPDEPDLAYQLASAQGRSGDFDAALVTLDSLIKQHPDLGSAYLLQGELYQMAGHEEQALLVYHRMTELFIIGKQYQQAARKRIESLRNPPASAIQP
jgi:tetratricopeptide (TPR) repeat protein